MRTSPDDSHLPTADESQQEISPTESDFVLQHLLAIGAAWRDSLPAGDTLAAFARDLPAQGERMMATGSIAAANPFSARAQQPPRRPDTSLATAWRALAAVLVVALLGVGFFALLHGIPRPGTHPTATATRIAATPTTALACTYELNTTVLVPMPPPVPSLTAAEIEAAVTKTAPPLPGVDSGTTYTGAIRFELPPVLVLPATYGDTAYNCEGSLPHYEVLVVASNGFLCLDDVLYNVAFQELRVLGSSCRNTILVPNGRGFVPASDYFPFVGVSSSAAVAALHSAKGVAPAAGTRPELVYFAPRPGTISDDADPSQPGANWTGGGDSPWYPMWRLHGADGKLYFVGIDGKVYTSDQLPIFPGSTFITNE